MVPFGVHSFDEGGLNKNAHNVCAWAKHSVLKAKTLLI